MPRRNIEVHEEVDGSEIDPLNAVTSPCSDFKQGELLRDISGKEWRLGKTVGVGGFGEIFLLGESYSREVKSDTPYVAKVERHSNGPLFVEINCYLRIAKPEMSPTNQGGFWYSGAELPVCFSSKYMHYNEITKHYLVLSRVTRELMELCVEEWKTLKNLDKLGMPHYIASGSHMNSSNKYRFLIIPRFERDLEKIFKMKKKFNLKTVLTISCQILDVLEYVHSKGYIHSDIKASNILLGCSHQKNSTPRRTRINRYTGFNPVRSCRAKMIPRSGRNLRPVPTVNYIDDIPFIDDILFDKAVKETLPKKPPPKEKDQIYLVDFGLAAKFVGSNGQHKKFCVDERKAHAGTVLFCSRDAHQGVISRRSDLESLAYNMIYWLTGTLPWYNDVHEPQTVEKKKQRVFLNLGLFLQSSFLEDCPKFMHDFFSYLSNLQFDSDPDYDFCKNIFIKALREYGYKNDQKLDFDNLEGWGNKQKKIKRSSENKRATRATLIIGPHRLPLHSNNVSLIKPLLRKKVKACQMNSMMNWSKILIQDPEVILKQANKGRERRTTEGSETGNLLHLDIDGLNPTYAMLEVFSRYQVRGGTSPSDRGDSIPPFIEGYTPAMMAIFNKINEQEHFDINENIRSCKTKAKPQKRRAVKRKLCDSQPNKKDTKVRASKSSAVVRIKSEASHSRKIKMVPTRRTYSLRG